MLFNGERHALITVCVYDNSTLEHAGASNIIVLPITLKLLQKGSHMYQHFGWENVSCSLDWGPKAF